MPKAAKEIVRQAELLFSATEGCYGMVRLTASGVTEDYWFRPLPSEVGGAAFEVVKAVPCQSGGRMAGSRYHVMIHEDATIPGCECPGHCRYGYCRHHWGLATLLRRDLV